MGKKYKGVYAVTCTAFDERGDFDEIAMRRHIRFLVDDCGVHGIIPTGSTGEFAFLNQQERLRIMEITLEEVDKKVPVYIGTAACSTRETIEYAQRAQRASADGVMVVSPYYGHLDQEELFNHFATLASNIDVPIILYNNPGTSGSDILPSTIARLSKYNNITAVKESTGIMQRVAEIVRLCGDQIEVLCGCDTLVLEMFLMGVEGWVAAPANVIGKQCVELYKLAVEQKNIERARELYFKLLPLISLFENSGKYVQLAKAGLEIMDRSIGSPREPLLPPNPELRQTLKNLLNTII